MIVFGNKNKVRAQHPSERIHVTYVPNDTVTGGTRTSVTVNDVVMDEVTNAGVISGWQFYINGLPFDTPLSIEYDPAFISYDKNTNIAQSVSDGITNVTFRTAKLGAVNHTVTALITGGRSGDHTAYVAGTLGEHVYNQITGLISGLSYSNSVAQWVVSSNQDVNNPNVQLNTNCYVYGLDMSGVSVISSNLSDDRYAPALVSPRHALVAAHVAGNYPPGTKVVFKRLDGTYAIATVIGSRQMTLTDGTGVDLTVLCFDADLSGVKAYKVLAYSDWSTYIPSTGRVSIFGGELSVVATLPILRKAMHYADGSWGSAWQINAVDIVAELYTTISGAGPYRSVFNTRNKNKMVLEQNWYGWGHDQAIGGDSGSPSFLLINGEPILICTQYNTANSVDISSFVDDINTAMNDLAGVPQGTYALQHPSLTAFQAF